MRNACLLILLSAVAMFAAPSNSRSVLDTGESVKHGPTLPPDPWNVANDGGHGLSKKQVRSVINELAFAIEVLNGNTKLDRLLRLQFFEDDGDGQDHGPTFPPRGCSPGCDPPQDCPCISIDFLCRFVFDC